MSTDNQKKSVAIPILDFIAKGFVVLTALFGVMAIVFPYGFAVIAMVASGVLAFAAQGLSNSIEKYLGSED